MSIDERLRRGLARNAESLLPDLEAALATTYGRSRRRQRIRHGTLAVASAAAILAAARVLDLSGLEDDAVPVTPPPSPTDLVGVQGPLAPGVYSLASWGESSATGPLPRAVLDLPEGYFGVGGYAVEAGLDGTTDDQLGHISLWHVVQVLTDPCRRRTATDAGTTVRDLARALAAQSGPSTRPAPVVLDGHDGLTLDVTVPPDIDITTCTSAHYSLWRTEPRGDSALAHTTPGVVNRLWILDVDGTRLVLLATLYPDASADLHQEQVSIAESVDFVSPDT